jgi:hypothetical protein
VAALARNRRCDLILLVREAPQDLLVVQSQALELVENLLGRRQAPLENVRMRLDRMMMAVRPSRRSDINRRSRMTRSETADSTR